MRRPDTHKDNAFANHKLNYHQGNTDSMEVKVDVVTNFTRPMQRQVWEGVAIREESCDILLNSKLDHYAPVVGRMEERREVVHRPRVQDKTLAEPVLFFPKLPCFPYLELQLPHSVSIVKKNKN